MPVDSEERVGLFDMDTEATVGPVLNSPRSLAVCRAEGVDPDTDLVLLTVEAALVATHQDLDAAERRVEWWRRRRDALLQLLRQRFQAMLVESTEAPRERSPLKGPKLLNMAEKLERVVKANNKHEELKTEYIQTVREKLDKRDAEKAAELAALREAEAQEVSAARSRENEKRDERLRRQQQQRAEDDARRREQLAQCAAMEREERHRQHRVEARRGQTLKQAHEKDDRLRNKQRYIAAAGAQLHAEKQARMIEKVSFEDKRIEDVARRRHDIAMEHSLALERRHDQNRRKKESAEAAERARVEALERRIAEGDRRRVVVYEERSEARLRALVSKSRHEDEHRRALEQHEAQEQEHTQDIAKHLETEEERVRRWAAGVALDRAERSRANAAKEEEHSLQVERARRKRHHHLLRLRDETSQKDARIASLHDTAANITHERVLYRQELERMRAATNVPPTSLTPGPMDYHISRADKYLQPNSPSAKIGVSSRPQARLDLAPGPGQYYLPPPRKNKGAVLPAHRDDRHYSRSRSR